MQFSLPIPGSWEVFMPVAVYRWLALATVSTALSLSSQTLTPQDLPKTAGEMLSGKRIVLADAVRGHAAIMVAGFSREGGNGTGAWVKAIRSDPALAGISLYQIAQIAGAPGLVRGLIKSGMKKNVPVAEHDSFIVLTQDDKPWRSYFEVSDDQVPYVVMIDASGKILWRGHGPAAGLEPKLKTALH
jgi:hypothetical protein